MSIADMVSQYYKVAGSAHGPAYGANTPDCASSAGSPNQFEEAFDSVQRRGPARLFLETLLKAAGTPVTWSFTLRRRFFGRVLEEERCLACTRDAGKSMCCASSREERPRR